MGNSNLQEGSDVSIAAYLAGGGADPQVCSFVAFYTID